MLILPTNAVHRSTSLFAKHKVDCQDQEAKGYEMVDRDGLGLEKQEGKDSEDAERNDLLNDLELHESEWSAVVDEANAVGWHLATILEQRYAPTDEDNAQKSEFVEAFHLRELEVAIPCHRHEAIAHHQEQYCI